VALKVTPRISANDYVRLTVDPSITRLGTKYSSTIAGTANETWAFLTRQVHTTALIPSGNTLVIGGLIEDSISTGNTKVPLLGDLPYVGLLFRKDSKDRKKQNLIIFITPTIVQDQDFQPTTSTFLKTTPPAKDDLEKDWSAWDSGKPAKWFKP
jgi:general secretion pathway protein D